MKVLFFTKESVQNVSMSYLFERCVTHKKKPVPGAPPQNVTGEAVGPTSIRVSWQPPPAESSNGRIVYYKLHCVESGRSDSEASVTKLNTTSITLDELKRWTEYRIWVLAGTSVGDGPPSYPIVVRTLEDGTNMKKLYTIQNKMTRKRIFNKKVYSVLLRKFPFLNLTFILFIKLFCRLKTILKIFIKKHYHFSTLNLK